MITFHVQDYATPAGMLQRVKFSRVTASEANRINAGLQPTITTDAYCAEITCSAIGRSFVHTDLLMALIQWGTFTDQAERAEGYVGRTMLWNAAQYLHRNQLGNHSRVEAMDLMDDIRRDYSNWPDLAPAHGFAYRDYPVFPSRIAA